MSVDPRSHQPDHAAGRRQPVRLQPAAAGGAGLAPPGLRPRALRGTGRRGGQRRDAGACAAGQLHIAGAARARPLRPPHRPGGVPPQLPRADGQRAAPPPARHAVDRRRRAAHVERAAAFMLFTELEPSVLCPVSMSYAVTPALRAQAGAVQATGCPSWRARGYDARFLPFAQKTAVTMGMGMTEKQGGSDVRANTTPRRVRWRRRLGPALTPHRPQVVLVGADVRRLPGAGADRHAA